MWEDRGSQDSVLSLEPLLLTRVHLTRLQCPCCFLARSKRNQREAGRQ